VVVEVMGVGGEDWTGLVAEVETALDGGESERSVVVGTAVLFATAKSSTTESEVMSKPCLVRVAVAVVVVAEVVPDTGVVRDAATDDAFDCKGVGDWNLVEMSTATVATVAAEGVNVKLVVD
ncbi:hypothetical protein BGZ94_005959, partial [Podila epigama]